MRRPRSGAHTSSMSYPSRRNASIVRTSVPAAPEERSRGTSAMKRIRIRAVSYEERLQVSDPCFQEKGGGGNGLTQITAGPRVGISPQGLADEVEAVGARTAW